MANQNDVLESLRSTLNREYENTLNASKYLSDLYAHFDKEVDRRAKNHNEMSDDRYNLYLEQEKQIRKINSMESNHYRQMQNQLLSLNKYKIEAQRAYTRTLLTDAKQIYELQRSQNQDLYSKELELEAKAYEEASKNNGKISRETLAQLETIAKKRDQYEREDVANQIKYAKASLQEKIKINQDEIARLSNANLDQINRQRVTIYEDIKDQNGEMTRQQMRTLVSLDAQQRTLEYNSSEERFKRFKNRIETVRGILRSLTNEIGSYIQTGIDIAFTDRIKAGMNNTANAYEQNFTSIAGYSGSNSRQENHNFIKGVLTEVNSNEYTKKGLKFAEDVFPEITNAVKEGFMGDEATKIAIDNAIDKKIMPWLETSSDTWVQLQFDLSSDRLQQLKGQQLLLQETREGNRILQSGIVNQITDSLIPSMDNLVANTTEVDDLNDEMYAKAMYLMNDMGYSKQEAMKAIQKEVDAYQNPYKALTSGDVGSKLLALDNLNGTDLVGNFANQMKGSGWAGVGAWAELTGLATGGETRTERSLNAYGDMDKAQQKYISELSREELKKYYEDKTKKLPENVTATYEYDAIRENDWAARTFDLNMHPHWNDWANKVLGTLQSIQHWLLNTLMSGLANFLSRGFDRFLGGMGGGGGGAGGGLISSIGGRLGGGLLPGAASAPGHGALGFMSGGMGAIAGTAVGVTAGAALAANGVYSIGQASKTLSNGGSTDTEREGATGSAILGGTQAALGIGGAGAILALGASNPIGWAVLAAGGLAFLGKAAWDNAHELSGNAKEVHSAFDEIKNSLREENTERLNFAADLKMRVDEATDEEEKRKAIIESGIISEKEAKNLNKKALEDLTNAYTEGTKSIQGASESLLNSLEKSNTDEQDKQQKQFLYEIQDSFDEKKNKGQANSLLTSDEQAMMATLMSGVTDEGLKGKYEQHLNSGGGLTYAEAIDIINGGADNWFDKTNMLDKGLDVEAMKRVQLLYGVGKDIEFHNFDKELQNEIVQGYNDVLQSYNSWKVATVPETKEHFKTETEKLYNVLYENDTFKKEIQRKINGQENTMKTELNVIANDLNLQKFKIGSSFIPFNLIAQLHKGERVLTEMQNKEYTENLISGKNTANIIELSVKDIVSAIQNQTSDIINYLRQLSLNTVSNNLSLNMSAEMGNTRIV